jgi:hypothetical protein
MLSPKVRIVLVQIVSLITGTFLFVSASGISSNFNTLRLGITTGLCVLAILSLFLQYKNISVGWFLLGLLFSPMFSVHLPRHIWVSIDIISLIAVAYFAYWATNPYKKGTRFEQYVATLFPEPEFVIHDRTRDISKFLNRRVESDAHPDFVFRNLKTNKLFAVECKWRGRLAQGSSGDLGIWWDLHQWERYRSYARESAIPVFVALGIGGSPEKPSQVYFFKLDQLRYRFLTQALLRSGMSASQVQNIL